MRLAEILGHLPLILILKLLSIKLHEHISSLLLSHHVSPLSHVLSGGNYVTLLVNASQIVVHASHGHELLLPNPLLFRKVLSCLLDHAIDLLASAF